jgi:ribosomal protein L11 methyltransferase
MAWPKATVSNSHPKRLIVYEIHGSGPPRGEPDDSGLLGIWSEHPFHYLFFEREPGAGLSIWLENQQGWTLRDCYSLDYSEWQQVAAESLRIGPFLIEMFPESQSQSPAEGTEGIVIRLDPGLVFGSGLHGSTEGCLLALASLFERFPVKKVVDMGTGTGILAIAGGMLGAARVLGVDKNPLAVRAARKNVVLNAVQDRVDLVVAEDLGFLKAPSDLLIMNLELPSLERLLAGDDWLGYRWVILSGFLKSQWDKLKVNIPPAFCVLRLEAIEDWLTVTVSRCEQR